MHFYMYTHSSMHACVGVCSMLYVSLHKVFKSRFELRARGGSLYILQIHQIKNSCCPPTHVGIVWSEGGGGQVTSLYKIWNETPRNHLEINGGTKAELQTEKGITKNKYNNVYVCNFFVVFFLIIFYCFFVCL